MMPKMDGFAVCRTARLEGIETPILFLTARNEGQDRVEGCGLGRTTIWESRFSSKSFC